MMKKRLNLLLLGLIFPLLSLQQETKALSCASLSLRELYDRSELIYVGYVQDSKYTVRQSEHLDNDQWKDVLIKATLVPEESFKGTPPKKPTLTAENFFPVWGAWMKSETAVKQTRPFSWFAAEIVPGGRYLIFQMEGSKNRLGGCSPNQLLLAQYDSPTLKKLRRFRDRSKS